MCRYACFGLADHLATVLSGSLKALGKVSDCARIYFIGNYCFMIPVGTVLAFYFNLGVFGVWIGGNTGVVLLFILLVRKMNSVHFKILCQEVHNRVQEGVAHLHGLNPTKTDTQ